MIDMIVGAVVALFLLGLPLAIITLFVASTLEGRVANEVHAEPLQVLPHALSFANYGKDKRRRIIYGRPFSIVQTQPDRSRPIGHPGNEF
jgi:hypothetical protein